jgi:hypothetical protein
MCERTLQSDGEKARAEREKQVINPGKIAGYRELVEEKKVANEGDCGS